MAFLRPILLALTALIPAITASPLPGVCHPHANFTLTADAPGAPFDGYTMLSDSLLAIGSIVLTPSATTAKNYQSAIFFKNDTTHLYTYLHDFSGKTYTPSLVFSPLAGNVGADAHPAANSYPHYEEYFNTSLSVWPPSEHIHFVPGKVVNPLPNFVTGGTGGWFACPEDFADPYTVSVGTQIFLNDRRNCTEFKARIHLTGFSIC